MTRRTSMPSSRETVEPHDHGHWVGERDARWLLWAAPALALPFLGKPPTLDEESYLAIGAQLTPLRPYDWTRAWAPWDGDGFVFAHPPLHLLQMWLISALSLPLMRIVAGLPWVLLLAWSVARLATRLTHHPGLAAAAWLGCTVVALATQDSLMVDLPAVALTTFAMAAYRDGLDGGRFELAGVALGLALATKYAMFLVVPVLLWHMARRGWRWGMLAIAAGIFIAVEAWLFGVYGRVHLWEVWSRRAEIPAGPFGERVVGTLARLALLPLPFVLWRTNPIIPVVGTALGLLVLALVRPAGLTVAGGTMLVLFTVTGGTTLIRAVVALGEPSLRRRHGDRSDALFLGGWTVAGVAAVVLLHNYASARYLLPIAAPVAIMLTRSAEEVPWGKAILRASVLLGAALALVLAVADYRFVEAGVEVASHVTESPPGRFAGEWSFRWALEQAGWTRYRPDEVLPAGTWVVAADNASPGELNTDALEPMRRIESADLFPVRIVDLQAGAGLYAETLGPLPFSLRTAPLEGATVYRSR